MNEGALPELPGGWVWTRLGDIAEKINPGFPSGNHNKESHGVPHLRPMNINVKGEIELSEVKYVQPDSYDSLLKGDVLFNNTNSPELLGKTSYIKDDTNWAYSNHMTRIRINSSFLNSAWISYYLHSLFLKGFFKMICTHHVNQASINSTFLSQKVPIPLPPLPEQRAIVSKIEQLFSDLDNGIKNFKKAQAQLKRYRQSVLKAACEGKLVPTEAELACTEGREYEAADALLARILKERREKSNGAKYKEPGALHTSVPPALPKGWCWATTDAIFWFITSGSRGWAKYYSDSGPVFIRVGNLNHNSITLDMGNIQRVQPPAGTEGTRTRVITGDILTSITADVGMIALVPEGIDEAYINQHIALARPVSAINPFYLAWFLASQEGGQRQFLKLQRGATKMGLGLDDIRAVNIPLPPLAEQSRIVAEVERRLSISDKMGATITESLQKAESLRQSILKKAFEGKLLNEKELEEARNAPDWEPAEKLLERIKAEKTNIKTRTKNNEHRNRSIKGLEFR